MTGDKPATPLQPSVVADIHELLQLAELVGVRFYELGARRSTSLEDRPESIEGAEQEVALSVRRHTDELEIRFRMVVTTPDADLLVDASVVYSLTEHYEITRELTEEFVERVAVMAAFPFLRESIFTSATRLGVEVPVLGMMRAGQFHVGEQTEGAESEADGAAESTPDA